MTETQHRSTTTRFLPLQNTADLLAVFALLLENTKKPFFQKGKRLYNMYIWHA